MGNLFLGLILSILPSRIRNERFRGWSGDLRTSAAFSGTTQLLVSLGLLVLRYPLFVESQMRQIDQRVFIGAAEQAGESAVRGFGLILLFAYLLTPLAIVLMYFAIEGAIRLIGATTTGEVVGTLPFVLLDHGISKWRSYQAERKLGPRVVDLVTKPAVDGSGCDLAIASCRMKPGWDRLITISYNDILYEIADFIEASGPRKYVYLLRYAPAHKVVRGLDRYAPEAVLQDRNKS